MNKKRATYDIFISYRRDGGEYTAKILHDRLRELGYDVFFDVESLRSGNFNTRLYSVIDECKDFVIVLSPGALDRCDSEEDWVRREIEYALEKGKNIVPILLRGFEFPAVLPPTIDAVRYKNGIEANSEFFEAFIEKLQMFLESKPAIGTKIFSGRVLKALAAVAVIVALTAGAVFTFMQKKEDVYPKTNDEVNIAKEVIYHQASNLTYIDIMGGYVSESVNAAKRYLMTGDNYNDTFNVISNAYGSISDLGVSKYAATDEFLGRLANSPFEAVEVKACNDAALTMQESFIDMIVWIAYVISDDFYATKNTKLEIVECYEAMLLADMEMTGFCANQLLLPITNEETLESFKSEILPTLTNIPLRASNWCNDYDMLENDIKECLSEYEKVENELSTIVGNTNMRNQQMRQEAGIELE